MKKIVLYVVGHKVSLNIIYNLFGLVRILQKNENVLRNKSIVNLEYVKHVLKEPVRFIDLVGIIFFINMRRVDENVCYGFGYFIP